MFTLGFDVAKDYVDAALINKVGQYKERWHETNTVPAITKLLKQLHDKYPKLQAGCEATGYYHLATVQACQAVKLACYVLNPIMTKQYAKSTVRGRKTDQDDAIGIARLVLRGEGSLATAGPQSLAKTYVRLATKAQHQKETIKLQEHFYLAMHEASGITIASPFTETLTALASLVITLRSMASTLVDKDTADLLRSIPGIGPVISTTVLAEIGDIQRFPEPKKFVAFAGLDLKVSKSGKVLNRNTRLTKRGSPTLRHALFNAANVARQHDSELAAYYKKKRTEGKAHTAATVAIARKLCYRIYAVLQRQTPYTVKPQ